MFGSLYVVTDKLVVNPETKVWCKLPYPGHPNGCPNYGKKDVCPPRAPGVKEFFDFSLSLFFVVVKFDLEEHVKKMHERLPHWSERQCRNLLYWQPSVMKKLRGLVDDTFHLPDMNVFNDKVTYVPEAMGVDVFETCFRLGVPIERSPIKYVHKIALVGRSKRKPMVIGSGYIPFIDKDVREPETFAEMAGMAGGW
jgi:hypothetical protein